MIVIECTIAMFSNNGTHFMLQQFIKHIHFSLNYMLGLCAVSECVVLRELLYNDYYCDCIYMVHIFCLRPFNEK